MKIAYPPIFMPMIMIGYPIFVRNDEILLELIQHGSFYNKVYIKPIEILEGNHSSGFKIILINFGAKKSVVINLVLEVLVNLLSKTHFHNIVTIKSIPPNLGGDPYGLWDEEPDTHKAKYVLCTLIVIAQATTWRPTEARKNPL
jgi:hypothetical protein